MQDDIAPSKDTDNTVFFKLYALHAAALFLTLLGPQVRLQGPNPDLISLGAESLWGEFTLVPETSAQVKETMASTLLSGTYWGPWKMSTIVLTKSWSFPAFRHFWKEHVSSPLAASLGGIGSLISNPSLDLVGTLAHRQYSLNKAQELWETFLITICLAATKVVIIFPMHKKVIPTAGICNSAEAYSECTWSIIQLTYPLTSDKDTALIQFYLSPSTWHTAIAVVNALDVEVIAFSMWHAKQDKFDISGDGICLAVMLIDEELYGIYYSRDTNSKRWSDMKQVSLWTSHHHTAAPVMIFLQGSNANLALITDVDNMADVQKAVAYVFGHTLVCDKAEITKQCIGGAMLHSMNSARLDALLREEDTQAEAAAGAGLGVKQAKVGIATANLKIMMKSQPPFVLDVTGSPDNIYVNNSDDLANNPSRQSSCKGTRKPTKGQELEREAYQQAEKGHQDRICSLEQEVIKLQLENSHLTTVVRLPRRETLCLAPLRGRQQFALPLGINLDSTPGLVNQALFQPPFLRTAGAPPRVSANAPEQPPTSIKYGTGIRSLVRTPLGTVYRTKPKSVGPLPSNCRLTTLTNLVYASLPGLEICIPNGQRIMTSSLSPASVYRHTVLIVTGTNCRRDEQESNPQPFQQLHSHLNRSLVIETTGLLWPSLLSRKQSPQVQPTFSSIPTNVPQASFLAESPFIHMETPTPKPRAKALKWNPKGKGELGVSISMTFPAKTANSVILKNRIPGLALEAEL
ncbi:hypothetical protein BDZ97DRAFT_1760085 [Flammula alnicola]|nr:hypothetical protein BDZ97DRAFT_1760085 [Flammula alnicola]